MELQQVVQRNDHFAPQDRAKMEDNVKKGGPCTSVNAPRDSEEETAAKVSLKMIPFLSKLIW